MDIQPELVRQLIDEQFPHWANLEIRPVARSGWDNRTFRLGESYLVRMPSAHRYAGQVEKEQRWLPFLGNGVTVSIPQVVAQGRPGHGYQWNWSVFEWLEGQDLASHPTVNTSKIARQLAQFMLELHQLDSNHGPSPGLHNFYRGGCIAYYDQDTRQYIQQLSHEIDIYETKQIWESALATQWSQHPVWVHGDLEPSNILVADRQLSAVIDFGGCAVGDPACDLVMAWTYFDEPNSSLFKSILNLDAATWQRGRGWALWKALFRMVQSLSKKDGEFYAAKRVQEKILTTSAE